MKKITYDINVTSGVGTTTKMGVTKRELKAYMQRYGENNVVILDTYSTSENDYNSLEIKKYKW